MIVYLFGNYKLSKNYLAINEDSIYLNIDEAGYPYKQNKSYPFTFAFKSEKKLDDIGLTPFVVPLNINSTLPKIRFETENVEVEKMENKKIQGIIDTSSAKDGRYLLCVRFLDNTKRSVYERPKEEYMWCSNLLFSIG
jgi:hypothetical protein